MSSSKKRNKQRNSTGTPRRSLGGASCHLNGSLTESVVDDVWTHCDQCTALVPNATHVCSDRLISDRTCFIREGCLFGAVWSTLEEGGVNDVGDKAARHASTPPWSVACVLAPATMSACRLRTGDWVLVEAPAATAAASCHRVHGGDGGARHLWRATARVWPCSQLALDTAVVTGRAAVTRATSSATCRLACVTPVAACCTVARSLTVTLHSAACDTDNTDNSAVLATVSACPRFRRRLLYELDAAVVADGVCWRMVYLGCAVTVVVCRVVPLSTGDQDVCDAMADLSVDSASQPTCVRRVFCVVTADTELCVTTSALATSAAACDDGLPSRQPVSMFGVDSALNYLERLLSLAAVQLSHYQSTGSSTTNNTGGGCGLTAPSAVLVHALPGCGKSLLARWLAERYSCHVLAGSRLAAAESGQHACRLLSTAVDTALATVAATQAPAVLFLDDIDSLPPGASALVAQLAALLDAPPAGLVAVATAARPELVAASLRRAGRLDRELELSPPDAAARGRILMQLLAAELSAGQLLPADVESAAAAAHGYVGADLRAVVCEARMSAADVSPDAVAAALKAALRLVRPSAVRQLHVQVPHVRWTDIAGSEALKLRLRQAVEWPLKHAAAFARLGIAAPRGLLMYGPPGCSKTMIARALATESGLSFIAIKGPELFSKWVGESERAVRRVFRRARQAAPAIVFIDEIDALAVKRADAGSSGSHSAAERVLAQLLTEMDGVGGSGGGRVDGAAAAATCDVIVVAATNRPDLLDPALLRPGRLDALVHVPLPDVVTRLQLLQLRAGRTPLAADVACEWLARRTDGYSGAEVVAVCHEAALRALQRDSQAAAVTRADFEQALETVQPRVTDYHRVYEQFDKKQATVSS